MQLVDEQVDVVARVADQREALLVARHVVAARPEQQLRRVVALVEVGAADGPAAVEALEVQARRAEVAQPVLLGVRAQRRAVGGDVVRDELADERPAGRDGRVVRVLDLLGLGAVAGPAGRADHVQQRLVGRERRQVGEHPAVAAAVDRRVDDAVRREAVVAGDDGLGADGHGGMLRGPRALRLLRVGSVTTRHSPACDGRATRRRRAARPAPSGRPGLADLGLGRRDVVRHAAEVRRSSSRGRCSR